MLKGSSGAPRATGHRPNPGRTRLAGRRRIGSRQNFEQFLASPRVRLEDKTKILDLAFAARMTPLFLNFLKVVAHRGRLDCLRQVRSSARQAATPCGAVWR